MYCSKTRSYQKLFVNGPWTIKLKVCHIPVSDLNTLWNMTTKGSIDEGLLGEHF